MEFHLHRQQRLCVGALGKYLLTPHKRGHIRFFVVLQRSLTYTLFQTLGPDGSPIVMLPKVCASSLII